MTRVLIMLVMNGLTGLAHGFRDSVCHDIYKFILLTARQIYSLFPYISI